MRRLFRYIFLLVVSGFIITSCIKKYENPEWEVDALTPVFNSSMNIYDLINDSSLKSSPGDSVFLVFNKQLDGIIIDSLIKLDVKPFIRTVKLDSIHLNQQTITNVIYLEEIIGEMFDDGATIPFSVTQDIPIDSDTIDASEYFHSITLDEGTLKITIRNGFPAKLDNVNYTITTLEQNDTIHSGTFASIPSNSVVTDTANLAGQQIKGNMIIHFGEITANVPAGTTVNYEDSLKTIADISDMTVYSAEARFPAQTIIHHQNIVSLENMVDTANNDTVKLKEASISKGFLEIEVISTVDQKSYFTYTIPNATKNGIPFKKEMTVPPAPKGESITKSFTYAFDNYQFDLTGRKTQDTINSFYNELTGQIDSTGEHVFLSLDDSVKVNVEMQDIKPAYVRGYLGKRNIRIGPGTSSFSGPDYFNMDSLSIKGAELTLTIENEMGIKGDLDFNDIIATNTQTHQNKHLDLSSLPNPARIPKATDDPLTSNTTKFQLNDSNANISEVMAINPDQFKYDMNIQLNPEGANGQFSNFVYANHMLDASIQTYIPLNIQANQLLLKDTIPFNNGNIKRPEDLREGTLKFIVTNEFPLKIDLTLYFSDKNKYIVDTLEAQQTIKAAPVNQNLEVKQPAKSTLRFFVKEERLPNIIQAEHVIIEARFETKPENKHLQLFDNYSIDIKCVGDFSYQIDNQLN